ncbi:MAG TPA: CHAD domain-containing protein [Blastocatellia bacterium]|nr:CHAD domain-containing protein [Blastocatellia bacterium]
MGFRIKEGEQVPAAIKRISLDQVDRSVDLLELRTRNKARAVHEARVCFKKIRAVLRLVQGEIGREIFKVENAAYRDTGRQLSAARDTVVVAGALEDLVREFGEKLADPDIRSLRKRLRRSRADQHIDRDQVAKVIDDLNAARLRVEGWPLFTDGFGALKLGVKRTYKKGRDAYAVAQAERTSESFHEWRKQVKYLWYQLSVLNPMWPKVLDTFSDELSRLSDYLSEDHDLSLLRDRADRSEEYSTSSEFEKLVQLIDNRRGHLQAKAQTVGVRIYSERPRAFANRLQSYWEAWRPVSLPEHPRDEQMTLAYVPPDDAMTRAARVS